VARYTARIRQAEAELATVAEAGAERHAPSVRDWDAAGPADKREQVAEAFRTPITVLPAHGTGRRLPATERILLVPRGQG
jgi:hypothetical protein